MRTPTSNLPFQMVVAARGGEESWSSSSHCRRCSTICSVASTTQQDNSDSRPRPQKKRGQDHRKAQRRIPAQKKTFHPAYSFNQKLQQLLKHHDDDNDDFKNKNRLAVAEQAEHLLLKQIQQDLPYDTVSYNLVLQAWARQHCMLGAQRADQLLARMLEEQASKKKNTIRADAYSYAAVLDAYAKSGGKLVAAKRANELLLQLEKSPDVVLQTDVCHNAVMNAWAVSGFELAGQRAEQILKRLEGHATLKPTRISYNACIKAFAKSKQPQEAQRLLEKMKACDRIFADKISYSTVIDAWARSEDTSRAAQEADRLLTEMEKQYAETRDEMIRPDIVAYTSVLAAYAQGDFVVDNKAKELLARMQAQGLSPNAPFLNAWIHLLSKTSQSHTAAAHLSAATDILCYMKQRYKEGRMELKPCKISYTAVISVLAQTGTKAAAKAAMDLLDELQTLWEQTSDPDYLPSAMTFTTILNAWARSNSEEAVPQAYKLLERMRSLYTKTNSADLMPSSIVYLQMFQVLANGREKSSAQKALDLLHEMNDLYRSGQMSERPDATTYASLVNAFTKSKVANIAELASTVLKEAEDGFQSGIGELRPTSLLYSAVLQAYAKSSSKEGVKLAEDLLERTKKLYKEGKVYAKPTALFYNAVIDAHARSEGGVAAAERAEELIDEMESRSRAGDPSVAPKTRTFNAALLAWKNSKVTEAPPRAEALLKRMNERYKAGDQECRPDRVTFNTIIAVWATSAAYGAAERAEEFLRFMEDTYRCGDPSLKPDLWTYNTAMSAYLKSNRKDAAVCASNLYARMKTLYKSGDESLRPDIIALTTLRTIWSQSDLIEAPAQVARIQREIDQLRQG